ncbi:hypothetical protein [Saccharopolyspora sp. ASAGF58]|uniref:hypothetical protein n=1 Tax=Saccharopolyspora sp. ASAGF58 TaxID=2719023 RepID=UPI00143FD1BA|nr:hypothetical protein [Saccharopolyspora sp. ASAGF58]QIZ33540.1 hypothetical protein FDZ84_00765 [Saccharopolyspora sp. ASAGF58]
MAVKTITSKIKATYEYERGLAMELLTNGIADRLHNWARDAQAVTLESERQAYDQADHGLEQHLGTTPYDAWEGVPEPHPDPASVHITAADLMVGAGRTSHDHGISTTTDRHVRLHQRLGEHLCVAEHRR